MSIRHQVDQRGRWIKARPKNCDPFLGTREECPNCGYKHVMPGYCQALDPINADKFPHLHGEMLSVTSSSNSVTHDEVSVTDELSVTPDDGVSVTCETCGEAFTPKRATAKFCTATCRQRARRQASD